MAPNFSRNPQRRGPDVVTEELVAVLTSNAWLEFKPLFELVYDKLRARNTTSGGEEMLRLRVYEKLQNLVNRQMVQKAVTDGRKRYKANAALSTMLDEMREAAAPVAAPSAR